MKQKVSGTWTRFVNNGGLVLQDRDNNDAVLRTYMWDGVSPGGIGGLLEMNLLAQHYNYLYDGKGNVASVLNNLQAEVAKYRYDAAGSLVASSGTLNQAYRFSTKRYLAGYGVSYFGYRFHVAHLGRWMTKDPIGEAGGINLYGMVGNSVVNKIDPWGLSWRDVPATGPVNGNESYPSGNNVGNAIAGLPDMIINQMNLCRFILASNDTNVHPQRYQDCNNCHHPSPNKVSCFYCHENKPCNKCHKTYSYYKQAPQPCSDCHRKPPLPPFPQFRQGGPQIPKLRQGN